MAKKETRKLWVTIRPDGTLGDPTWAHVKHWVDASDEDRKGMSGVVFPENVAAGHDAVPTEWAVVPKGARALWGLMRVDGRRLVGPGVEWDLDSAGGFRGNLCRRGEPEGKVVSTQVLEAALGDLQIAVVEGGKSRSVQGAQWKPKKPRVNLEDQVKALTAEIEQLKARLP